MKKLSESIWSDMQDRSTGEKVREEDLPGNIKYIQSVDMGTSVLWSDRPFMIDDNIYFDFNTAKQLIKNSDWRLPSVKEINELINITTEEKNTDEVYILKSNNNELKFNKCGYVCTDNEPPHSMHHYYSWTSHDDSTTNISTFHISNNISIVPLYKLYKACVRLVKDK